ncbi:hypothetical protein [Actinokineospora diospyrosa]|uniref:Uncharacterized protein n=1 Tax=Actinokineospora diospyrosa TaxID=103728 RepID=A0ABT1I6D5_9PSEU|nr:hypothetical protein [Actinokineospora diospyrosa]MCP2268199.1 hypothetical protein [Actinokineospora diospyrosa]
MAERSVADPHRGVTAEDATAAVRRALLRSALALVAGVVSLVVCAAVASIEDADAVAAGISPAGVGGVPDVLFAGAAALAALALWLVPTRTLLVLRWALRLRSVRKHGWRRGHATATPGAPRRIRVHSDSDEVDDVDDVTVLTCLLLGGRGPTPLRKGPVLLGGSGRAAVIMFCWGGRVEAGREVR